MGASMLVFAFVLVIVPLLAGLALILSSRRGGLGFPACGSCHYNLTATAGRSTTCPECGADILQVGIIPPRGQRNGRLLWSGVGLIVLALTCVGGGTAMILINHRPVTTVSPRVIPVPPMPQPPGPAPQPADAPPPPPLTQSQVDAMAQADVLAALEQTSKARRGAIDPEVQERLRNDFTMLLNRLRLLRATAP